MLTCTLATRRAGPAQGSHPHLHNHPVHPSKLLPVLGLSVSCTLLLSAPANANNLVQYDFENFVNGQKTGTASSITSGISSSFTLPNNGVETINGNKLSLTRQAGLTTYPSLSFTNTNPISLDLISFYQSHNHNNTVTRPGYNVDVKFVSGSNVTTLSTFLAQAGGNSSLTISGPGQLSPGTYSLRWVPRVSSTNSDFFALDNITLTSQVPGPLPVLGMGVAYRFSRTLRKRIGAQASPGI